MFGGSRQLCRARQVSGIRVVVLEGNVVFRHRLQAIVAEDSSYSVVGCAGSWDECAALVAEYLPEILIAAASLLPPGAEFQLSGVPVIVQVRDSGHADQAAIERAFQDVREELLRVRYELYSRKACELSSLLEHYLTGLNTFSYFSSLKACHSGETMEIPVTQVQVIEASGNYVRIYTSGGFHMMREAISCLQAKLDPSIFIRVHRSYLVNIRHISRLSAPDGGGASLFLQDGNTIPIGPNYRDEIVRLFESVEKLSA